MPTRFHPSLPALLLAAATAACGHVVVLENVSGTVLGADGVPLPGARVLIGGSPTSTDEAGRFSAAGVVAPYDVAVVAPSTAWPARVVPHVYLGMSDTAPTFRMSNVAKKPPSCTLVVTIPATSSPSLAASVIIEVPEGSPTVTYEPLGLSTTQPSFSLTWTAAAKVRVHAFESQVDPVTMATVHYLGYDTTELELADGAALQWSPSWKPSPFPESVVSATLDVPPGYVIARWPELWMSNSFVANSAAVPEMSFVVPVLPGASFRIDAQADGDSGFSSTTSPPVAPGTQGLHLTIDRAPVLRAPADGGTLGVGSPVTWTSDGEGTALVTVSPANQIDHTLPLYYLFGGEGAATFPDLSALGVSLHHGASYTVSVGRVSAAATVDDLAALEAHGSIVGPYSSSGGHEVTTP